VARHADLPDRAARQHGAARRRRCRAGHAPLALGSAARATAQRGGARRADDPVRAGVPVRARPRRGAGALVAHTRAGASRHAGGRRRALRRSPPAGGPRVAPARLPPCELRARAHPVAQGAGARGRGRARARDDPAGLRAARRATQARGARGAGHAVAASAQPRAGGDRHRARRSLLVLWLRAADHSRDGPPRRRRPALRARHRPGRLDRALARVAPHRRSAVRPRRRRDPPLPRRRARHLARDPRPPRLSHRRLQQQPALLEHHRHDARLRALRGPLARGGSGAALDLPAPRRAGARQVEARQGPRRRGRDATAGARVDRRGPRHERGARPRRARSRARSSRS
jgi:hypothetical protein